MVPRRSFDRALKRSWTSFTVINLLCRRKEERLFQRVAVAADGSLLVSEETFILVAGQRRQINTFSVILMQRCFFNKPDFPLPLPLALLENHSVFRGGGQLGIFSNLGIQDVAFLVLFFAFLLPTVYYPLDK